MTAAQQPSNEAIVAALHTGDIDAALELIAAQLSGPLASPQRYSLHLMRARLLAVLGDGQSALADFEVAIQHAASDAQRGSALLARAELAESAGWLEQTRADLVDALPLLAEPAEQLVARHVLGRIERDHGDLGTAIELLADVHQALSIADADSDQRAEVTLDLAMALRLAGDTGTSIALLEALVDAVEPAFAARILIQIGTTYGFAGQLAESLAAYERALPLLPDSADRAIVRYNRAVVMRDHAMFDEARQEVERALVENAGENPRVEFDALLLAGIIARELHDFPRSLDLLREASEREPDGDLHGRARLEVGTTLAATGLHGPAILEFGSAIALCVDAEERARALRYRGVSRNELGLLDAALADFDASIALTADPDERARGQSTRAALLTGAARWAEALAALDDALATVQDPALSLQLLVQRGSTRSQSGRLDEAITDFQRAAELAEAAADNDVLSRVLLDLGAIFDAQDELDAAVAAFNRSAASATDNSVAYLAMLNLGNLHASLDEPVQALSAFDRAASAAADDRDARSTVFLARAKAFLRWGRYADADLEYKRILTLQPSVALLEQASVGRRANRDTLKTFKTMRDQMAKIAEAMDKPSYRANPLLRVGMLSLMLGDTEAALLNVTRATTMFRLRKEKAEAFASLALVHASLGQCDEAAQALAKAREYDPEESWRPLLAGEAGWLWCRGHPGVSETLMVEEGPFWHALSPMEQEWGFLFAEDEQDDDFDPEDE